MEKKTLYALGVLIGLVLLAVVSLRSPEKGERVGERPRPVPEIKGSQVATLEIAQAPGTDKVTLSKQNDKWQVTAPYDKPADQTAAKNVIEQLEKLRFGDITTEKKDRHQELEVSDDKATHVIAKDSSGKVLCDLFVGKSSGNATMVRIAGKDEVWQAMDMTPFNFRKEGKAWRDHTVFDLKADEAEKVELVGDGTSVMLERLPAAKGADGKESTSIYEAKWKVIEGAAGSMKPDSRLVVDDSLVNGVVQTLATLHAGDFLDSAKPEEGGLTPAQNPLVAKVMFKGGKSAGIKIGTQKGEDFHVQALEGTQIFTLKKFTVERAAHLPRDIYDKTLTSLKEDDLTEVSVQQDKDLIVLKKVDKAWKADKIADYDEAKGKTLAESFASLSGSGYVAKSAPELAALAKGVKATITLKPKTGAPTVLKVGETKGDEVVVQKVGQDAMWVKKFNADRFLKKPADLAKDKK